MRRFLAVVFVAIGCAIIFIGAREYLDSIFGQEIAARRFAIQPPPLAASGSPLAPKPGATIAKLSIPRLNASFFVVEGDDDRDLRAGPGHLTGSAMPGGRGNCIIAGHRDTHFRVLKDIRPGDEIRIESNQREFVYRVAGSQIVWPSNTASLKPTPDAELHLITCFPFYYVGSAPKRFVVRARLVGETLTRAENRGSLAQSASHSVQ